MTTTDETCLGGVRSAAAVTEELRQGSGSGSAPPPPPAPAAGNVDQRVIRDQIKAQQRQLRDQRMQSAKQKLGSVHRQYWIGAGVVAGLVVGSMAWKSYRSDQRATAIALAQIASGNRPAAEATATTGAPQVIEGIPNPLDQLPLTNQAKWMIGAGGDGVLPPKRSTTVLVQMLEGVDMCGVYVGLSDKAEILVSFDPRPSFVPLVQGCAAEAGTTVPVPADPVPTTVAQ